MANSEETWWRDKISEFFPAWEGRSCVVLLMYFVLFGVFPVYFVTFIPTKHHVDTRTLRAYIDETWMKPAPYRSSWVEHDVWNPGKLSTDTDDWHTIQDYVIFAAVLASCRWDQFFTVFSALCSQVCDLYLHSLEEEVFDLLRKRKFAAFFMFMFVTFLFSALVVMSLDGLRNQASFMVFEIIQLRLDHSVVHIGLGEKNLYRNYIEIPHPSTNGTDPPFFLKHIYRYNKEDAVLNCVFTVWSLHNATPIPSAFFWKKDGKPINTSSRVYTSTTVTAASEDPLLLDKQLYIIDSNLTIELIGETDFASYTCAAGRFMFVHLTPESIRKRSQETPNPKQQPKPEQESGEENTGRGGKMPTPDNKCGCEPSSSKHFMREKLEEKKDTCVQEFKLIKSMPQDVGLPVLINPGGVLIDEFSYITEAQQEDIRIGVTDHNSNRLEQNIECCSLSSKIYWIFFKGGMFTSFPFTRQVNNPHARSVSVGTWNCMCHNSYGVKKSMLERIYFNKTTQTQEIIDILYPVHLELSPTNNNTGPIIDSFPFCMPGTENSGVFCYYLHAMLENSYYTVYTYDIIFLLLGVPFLLLGMYGVYILIYWLKRMVMAPVRSVITEWAVSISGPQTFPGTSARFERQPSGKNTGEDRPKYDVFLSYNCEEKRDVLIATCIKDALVSHRRRVYDSCTDVVPGRVASIEICEAINNSKRFVVVTSPAYEEDDEKFLEFVLIKDWIIRQCASLRQPLLLMETERVCPPPVQLGPCSTLSLVCRDGFTDKKRSVRQFQKWTSEVPPLHEEIGGRGRWVSTISKLKTPIIVVGLLYMARYSPLPTFLKL